MKTLSRRLEDLERRLAPDLAACPGCAAWPAYDVQAVVPGTAPAPAPVCAICGREAVVVVTDMPPKDFDR